MTDHCGACGGPPGFCGLCMVTADPEPQPEYKGIWPGGWSEDSHGNLAFALRGGDEEPVWACQLCRKGQLHTLAEHQQIIGLAIKR